MRRSRKFCQRGPTLTVFIVFVVVFKLMRSHPGSGSDRTFASVRQVTALVIMYIGRLVTCGIDYSFTP